MDLAVMIMDNVVLKLTALKYNRQQLYRSNKIIYVYNIKRYYIYMYIYIYIFNIYIYICIFICIMITTIENIDDICGGAFVHPCKAVKELPAAVAALVLLLRKEPGSGMQGPWVAYPKP